jgi:4-hydroxybenzoate polyprenyltransferase
MSMPTAKQRSLRELATGFFLLTHPGPVTLHVVGVAVFAVLTAWSHFDGRVIVLVIAAHAAMQCSISMINDYCDRCLDALSKPNKPIVRGLVTPREALAGGIGMALLMLVLLLFLPPLALLISLLYLALGQAYNFGLKSTPWSGLVFALAIPLIPLYALAGVGRLPLTAFWMVPVGFLLGAAINLANSLPDIESDQAGHANTLAVRLGVRGSLLACPALIVLAAVLMGVLMAVQLVRVQPWLLWVILGGVGVTLGAQALFLGPVQPLSRRKLYFYVVTLSCLLLGAGWFLVVAL